MPLYRNSDCSEERQQVHFVNLHVNSLERGAPIQKNPFQYQILFTKTVKLCILANHHTFQPSHVLPEKKWTIQNEVIPAWSDNKTALAAI